LLSYFNELGDNVPTEGDNENEVNDVISSNSEDDDDEDTHPRDNQLNISHEIITKKLEKTKWTGEEVINNSIFRFDIFFVKKANIIILGSSFDGSL
jgi:hypothetical protein